MSTSWKNVFISEDNNENDNFEFNYLHEDEDIDMLTIDEENDNSSSITNEIGSSTTESINNDDEILPFSWDRTAFRRAQKLLDNDEINDEVNWDDINFDETSSQASTMETESVMTMLTSTEEENRYQIENTSDTSSSLTPCIILDLVDGEIKRCSKLAQRQRPLAQLAGTWEVDKMAFTNAKEKNELDTLGICENHFNYDQNTLHISNIKKSRSVQESWIYHRRCLFCNKYKYFFGRGNNCMEHSVCVVGRNIQVPCIGLKACSVFNTQNIIIKKLDGNNNGNEYTKSRYICTQCFNLQGGHVYERPGSGKKTAFSCEKKHEDDTTKSLKLLGQWILDIAASEDKDQKEELLIQLSSILSVFDQSKQSVQLDRSDLPSLFLVKTALRLGKVNINKIMDKSIDITSESSRIFGEKFGILTWKSRNEVRENKQGLEKPTSLDHYQESFPSFLTNFFDEFIITLERKKNEVVNKKRVQRNLEKKSLDIIHAKKKSAFFTSMILTIAFPGINIWLTHVMSSLCRKPNLLSSLYAILCTANVVSHTQTYERRLEKIRINEIEPRERLLTGDNIWNVSVVDNIDFKAKTFSYGNIFDATRLSSHATLRMVFQFSLPMSLDQIINSDMIEDNNNESIPFGKSDYTNNLLSIYENIFNELLQIYLNDWDINNLYDEIAKKVPLGSCSRIPPPNVVILEPGENPNCDENVHNACEMYYDDVGTSNSNHLDIACDEAIFRRLISFSEKKDNVRLFLGQWHTSKDMCSALITIFSGYGIFNLAANLGVLYLDKLEKVVDYQATCRVLELIWIAVGIAICKHLHKKNKNMNDIENENNEVLKVWYYYFCWAGYWFGHKQGIRRGNYDMQFKNLLAFSPLFPVAGKSNYARSVTYFLAYVNDDPTLQKLLQYVCSVNLTQPGHYFGFDEALERFGVMFVKQNISRNCMDSENLKKQISSVQAERERLTMLLSEYVGDIALIRTERTVKSRKESLWKLANDLEIAFDLPDPLTHELFKNTKEMNKEGFQRLFSCYDHGIDRLNAILRQDVYQTETRVVKGRRARDIVSYKSQTLQLEKPKKGKAKVTVHDDNNDNNNSNNNDNNNDNDNRPMRKYRTTTENEKEILKPLLLYSEFPNDNDNADFLNDLFQQLGTDWDLSRVRKYWSNHNLFKSVKK